jgi:hypothetical protein
MTQILRYQLQGIGVVTTISMPKQAKVFDAIYSPERHAFSIYVVAETTDPEFITRNFTIVSTGSDVPGMTPIRAIILPDGFHVFHVMEIAGKSSMTLKEHLTQTSKNNSIPEGEGNTNSIKDLENAYPFLVALTNSLNKAAQEGKWSYIWRCNHEVLKGLSGEEIYKHGYIKLQNTELYKALSSWVKLQGMTMNVAPAFDIKTQRDATVAYPFIPEILEIHIDWR